MNRRQFLLGSTALVSLPALPAMTAAQDKPIVCGRVSGFSPPKVAVSDLHYQIGDGPVTCVVYSDRRDMGFAYNGQIGRQTEAVDLGNGFYRVTSVVEAAMG